MRCHTTPPAGRLYAGRDGGVGGGERGRASRVYLPHFTPRRGRAPPARLSSHSLTSMSSSDASASPEECAICRAALDADDPACPPCELEPCAHAFHYACILRWVLACRGGRPRCPCCRAFAAAALVGGGSVRHAFGGDREVAPLGVDELRRAAELSRGGPPVAAATTTLPPRRLAPARAWLTRDLRALLPGHDTGVVVEHVLGVAAATAGDSGEDASSSWIAAVAAAATPYVGAATAPALAGWLAAFVASGASTPAAFDLAAGVQAAAASPPPSPRRAASVDRAPSLSSSDVGRSGGVSSGGSDAYAGAAAAEAAARRRRVRG